MYLDYQNEKEFSDAVVLQMLNNWGVSYKAEEIVRHQVGSQTSDARADFVISFQDNVQWQFLIEVKKSTYTAWQVEKAREQAAFYSLYFNITIYSVISQDGFWIYKRELEKEDILLKHFSIDEIIEERNGNSWVILETLLYLIFGPESINHDLYRQHKLTSYPRTFAQPLQILNQQHIVQNEERDSIYKNNEIEESPESENDSKPDSNNDSTINYKKAFSSFLKRTWKVLHYILAVIVYFIPIIKKHYNSRSDNWKTFYIVLLFIVIGIPVARLIAYIFYQLLL